MIVRYVHVDEPNKMEALPPFYDSLAFTIEKYAFDVNLYTIA